MLRFVSSFWQASINKNTTSSTKFLNSHHKSGVQDLTSEVGKEKWPVKFGETLIWATTVFVGCKSYKCSHPHKAFSIETLTVLATHLRLSQLEARIQKGKKMYVLEFFAEIRGMITC